MTYYKYLGIKKIDNYDSMQKELDKVRIKFAMRLKTDDSSVISAKLKVVNDMKHTIFSQEELDNYTVPEAYVDIVENEPNYLFYKLLRIMAVLLIPVLLNILVSTYNIIVIAAIIYLIIWLISGLKLMYFDKYKRNIKYRVLEGLKYYLLIPFLIALGFIVITIAISIPTGLFILFIANLVGIIITIIFLILIVGIIWIFI